MIKNTDVKLLYERTKGFCECGCKRQFVMGGEYPDGFGPEIHHIHRKSQYQRKDRNQEWNLSLLYGPHHKAIHNGQNRDLDRKLKSEADIRKPPEFRDKRKIRKQKIVYGTNIHKYDKKKAQELYSHSVDYFKNNHDGLSPSQYKYQQQKFYFEKMTNVKPKRK